MTALLTMLCAVLFLSTPEEEVAGLYGEPDIFTVTYHGYLNLGQNNFEMKMLANIYMDSLETALQRSLEGVLEHYSDTPEMQEYISLSHEAFLAYAESWARVSEERMWWYGGERTDGTARGYNWSETLAGLYWKKTFAYLRMAGSEDPWLAILEPSDDVIGGSSP